MKSFSRNFSIPSKRAWLSICNITIIMSLHFGCFLLGHTEVTSSLKRLQQDKASHIEQDSLNSWLVHCTLVHCSWLLAGSSVLPWNYLHTVILKWIMKWHWKAFRITSNRLTLISAPIIPIGSNEWMSDKNTLCRK